MSLRPSDLFSPSGTIDRMPYLLVGLIGFVIKHPIDRWIAARFWMEWRLTSYWMPLVEPGRLPSLLRDNGSFFLTLLAAALPFIWVGVALTLKRLRAAGLPLGLVVLFFVPYLNLLYFALLSAIPSRPGAEPERPAATDRPPVVAVSRWWPESRLGSGAAALAISVVFGLLSVSVSIRFMRLYSWSLFVETPFCMGLIATLLHGFRQPRRLRDTFLLAILSTVLLGVALIGLDIEGAVCLLMAAPLGGVLTLLGGVIGYSIQKKRWRQRGAHALLLLAVLCMPILMGADHLSPRKAPLRRVTTSIEIDAAPARVWREVVAFSEIPPPEDWLFRAGISYPVRAAIDGQGRGAVRHCVFSTGEFLEPIEIWDEPRLLEFSVSSTPPPMVEWTPYSDIVAPHLSGYFIARRGHFLLTPLPGGRTRVEGSTWYENAIRPGAYWWVWSDAIIHRIHTRVLKHIRDLAEGSTP